MAGKKKKISVLVWMLIVFVLAGIFGLYKLFGSNTGKLTKGEYLYVKTGSDYTALLETLKEGEYLNDLWSFNVIANRARYPNKVKAGKYRIVHGMSNFDIIRMLRSGRQEPVKLVINKVRTKQDLVNMISTNLEATKDSLNYLLTDSTFLAAYQLDTSTGMCLIIPDTYEFYWNTSAYKILQKMGKNYFAFWTDERKQLATAKGLSATQIATIASIVEEETNMNDDKGNIASVYINRLQKGIPLQADPTVKFAIRDFTIRRVTGEHLMFNSPYNTYMYVSLPPGPICTPSKKTIDAVLHAPDTKYLFFCAKPDFSGYSVFAATLAEHQKNAKAYQKALDEKGIH
jgi:UPF0755 protein